MLLNKINATTESCLTYYKKLVEVEGALISFNMGLVHRKLNELKVVTFQFNNHKEDMIAAFEKETGKEWTDQNFSDYCSENMSTYIAQENLKGYIKAVQEQLATINETLEQASETANKILGNHQSKKPRSPKIGVWSRKANIK